MDPNFPSGPNAPRSRPSSRLCNVDKQPRRVSSKSSYNLKREETNEESTDAQPSNDFVMPVIVDFEESYAPTNYESELYRRSSWQLSNSQSFSNPQNRILQEHATSENGAIGGSKDNRIEGEGRSGARPPRPTSAMSGDSLTLKDRQNALNATRAFGIRLWKPAVYKKHRSMDNEAEADIHDEPVRRSNPSLINLFWVFCFGVPLFFITFSCWLVLRICSCIDSFQLVPYAQRCQGLMWYLLYPFGKHVRHKLHPVGTGSVNGNSATYSRRFSADAPPNSPNFLNYSFVVNPMNRSLNCKAPRTWTLGRLIYDFLYFTLLAPSMLLVACICSFSVFFIPCARLLFVLCKHLRKCPLEISFRSNVALPLPQNSPDMVLLCIKRAASLKYYKYTLGGCNILYINMFFIIIPTIAFHYLLEPGAYWFSSPSVIFCAALVSIVPLAYFIGMAVASISAQSSMGMGAFINAFFGSVVEVFLYLVALKRGNGKLVEGSVVGSILAGVLLMPGFSMCAGAVRKKFQFFNSKSAGATSTMLLFSVLAAFSPTLVSHIYDTFEEVCVPCGENCQRCTTKSELDDTPFFRNNIRPFAYWCAALLLCAYVVGLWFTLRTHAAHIWQNTDAAMLEEEVEVNATEVVEEAQAEPSQTQPPLERHWSTSSVGTLSELLHERDLLRPQAAEQLPLDTRNAETSLTEPAKPKNPHGEDAPNWSRERSTVILLVATVLYAVIAEILVKNVDTVLKNFPINEKLLGLTIFALVPNTTEFMNAISFALNENIALSMEIGSAYALQVCLLQIPCLVAYSAAQYYMAGGEISFHNIFPMVFPLWDVICVIICVFLLTYVHSEGKSNYFKGTILVLSYLVSILGFYYSL
ncbi:calcium permease [Schizosaccharomyces japonicus yFS275]|uniref:Calcium permease n=1 Tax=Schizosaccharomyces japonicus (strain yFS275 / FY16936) TaxID=402676 RepID=B6K5Q3_SCHJY|nr:calcium permease [Schizosaccharomyces japonicus yFS275]EEB08857.1 calcium permease [Schizosaccharomyces japonicus yFS275]